MEVLWIGTIVLLVFGAHGVSLKGNEKRSPTTGMFYGANVAHAKSAFASSHGVGDFSTAMTDGENTGAFNDDPGQCAATSAEEHPAVTVSLGNEYQIRAMSLWSTDSPSSDAPATELELEVRIGNNLDSKTNPLCSVRRGHRSAKDGFQCSQYLCGKYISVHRSINGITQPLRLCEIRAFSATTDSKKQNCNLGTTQTTTTTLPLPTANTTTSSAPNTTTSSTTPITAAQNATTSATTPITAAQNATTSATTPITTAPNATTSATTPITTTTLAPIPPAIPQCSQLVAAGNCTNITTRYYFNKATCLCETFNYSGCGGNDNNFATLIDCVTACNDGAASSAEFCLLEPNPGNCTGRDIRYAYNPAINLCKRFQYTGCGGNQNNFPSKTDCRLVCKNCRTTHTPVDE